MAEVLSAPGSAMSFVLLTTLQVAVPLRIRELELMAPAERRLMLGVWRSDAVEAVAHRGDILMFKGGKKGETANVFNGLAKGIAALAHAPGGVLFAGCHWCLAHPGGKAASSISELACESPGWPEAEPEAPKPEPRRKRPITTVTTSGVL